MSLHFVCGTRFWLKDSPEFHESWVRDVIAGDPALLGLGPLEVVALERAQPGAGRLDLLLQTGSRRYVVELMLGRMDESHIVRAIEYWDLESRRHPRYQHLAVLVAEEMTCRFLNVLALFARVVPLIALQMNAIRIEDKLVLNFTKVLDQTSLTGSEEDQQRPNSDWWQQRTSLRAMRVVDSCLHLLREFDPQFTLIYHKQHITLRRGARPCPGVSFRPMRHAVRVEVRVPDVRAFSRRHLGLEALGLDHRSHHLRFTLTEADLARHRLLLRRVLAEACLNGSVQPPAAGQIPIWENPCWKE